MTERPTPAGPLHRVWHLLGEQRTGIVCAFTSAALLGLGSFIIDSSPELYRGLSMDDLRFFFAPMRWQFAWFYALVLSLGLWAVSALICTWDSVASRIRRRISRPSAYGAALLHVTFVLALVAHLWGGLRATSDRYMVAGQGTTIHDAVYRAVSVETESHPNGMPRYVTATLERTSPAGVEQVTVGFNRPITSGWGANELLLADLDSMPDGLLLRHKGEQVVLRDEQPVMAGGDMIVLRQFHDPRRSPSLRVPVVDLLVGGQPVMVPLDPNATGETAFLGANETPVVTLNERNNPSVPLVLLVALLLVVGVVLVVWERIRTGRREEAEAQG